ncbi:MAG: glycerophosphodiester phosphodiesterase [Pseudomonadota bacterium]
MTNSVHSVELQGHRGARGVLPENTIPSFQNAIAAGSDCLELDIAMTSDGKIVITHDPVLSPDITRKGGDWVSDNTAIKSLSYEQLQAYDVGRLRPGSRYARRFPKQEALDGTRMPLLAELFALPETQSKPALCFDIEIKTSPETEGLTFSPAKIADTLIAVIDEAGLRKRSRIRSFDWRSLVYVKRKTPDISLAFLTASRSWLDNLQIGQTGKSPWLGGIDIDDFAGSPAKAIKHLGGQIWAPYYKDLSKEELEVAQSLGLKVIVWTVNSKTAMQRLLRMGVDGITTDYPALGRQVIDEFRAARKPSPRSRN